MMQPMDLERDLKDVKRRLDGSAPRPSQPYGWFELICVQLSDLPLYLHPRFAGMDEKFGGTNERLGGLDRRFDSIERRFDEIDKRFDKMDAKIDALPRAIAELITNRG